MAWSMPNAGQWNPTMGMTPDLNMGSYTQEQWTAMQQQNWQQWAQWQQQYAQWQSQYGDKYTEQMQAMLSMGVVPPPPPTAAAPPPPTAAAPPPAPPPPEKPPPPPHENNQPLYGSTPSQPAPVPPPSQHRTVSTSANYGNNRNWSQLTTESIQKPSAVNAEALQKLAEEEHLFDIQFKKWEEEIDKWRRENVNHPDKQAYKEYEQKFEACRAQLLERRKQMKRKRDKLLSNTTQVTNTNVSSIIPTGVPPPQLNTAGHYSNNQANNFYQHKPQQINPKQQQHSNSNYPKINQPVYDSGIKFNKDSQNRIESYQEMNQEDQSVNEASLDLDYSSQSGSSSFLPIGTTNKGIPGLDLVPESDKPNETSKKSEVIDITEEQPIEQLGSKGPDYTKISKGINEILGDEKIINILSMVREQTVPKGNNNMPNVNFQGGQYNIPLSNYGVLPHNNMDNQGSGQYDNINNRGGEQYRNNTLSNNKGGEQYGNNIPPNNRGGEQYGNNIPSNNRGGEQYGNNILSNNRAGEQFGNNIPPNTRGGEQYGNIIPPNNRGGEQYGNNIPQNNRGGGKYMDNIPPSNRGEGQYSNNMLPNNQGNKYQNFNNQQSNNRSNMSYNSQGGRPNQTLLPIPTQSALNTDSQQQYYDKNVQYGQAKYKQDNKPYQGGSLPYQDGILRNEMTLMPLMQVRVEHQKVNDFTSHLHERRPMSDNSNPVPLQSPKQKWVEEPLFTPSIIVEYEHKPLRLKARDFLEPVHMFDYNHMSKDGEVRKKNFEREANDLFTKKTRRLEEDYSLDKYGSTLFSRDYSRKGGRESLRDEYLRDEREDFHGRGISREERDDSRYRGPPRDERDDHRFRGPLRDERDEYRLRGPHREERDRDDFHIRGLPRQDHEDRKSAYNRYDDKQDRFSTQVDFYRESRDRERDRDRERERESYKGRNRDYKTNEIRSRSRSRDRDFRKRAHSRDSRSSDLSGNSLSKKLKDKHATDIPTEPKHVVMIDDILESPGRDIRPQKIVIIMRGLPGSGKSYLSKLIRDREAEHGGTVRIMSIDDYFMQESEIEEKDPATGKIVKKPSLKYEYDEKLEETYMNSLKRAFKRSLTDGYFSFLIFDAVNDHLQSYADVWNYGRQNGFQVYICHLQADPITCHKRNIHNRTLEDIEVINARFFPTPAHHIQLEPTTLLQNAAITDVTMEDVEVLMENALEPEVENVFTSKWEKMDDAAKLARLDGTSKPLRPSQLSMEDYLQIDEWKPNTAKPGKKTVRWADIEERREQEKMRAIGFVVGQTDWNRMTDPTMGSSALTQTKYIERVRRY